MLDDAFKICLDSVFNPNLYNGNVGANNINNTAFPVKGYKDDENLWRKMKFLKKFNGKDLSI